MKLLKLSLRNFKGTKSFTLDTRGGNVAVFGDNATGKTTLFDAFIWLLFDKDSANSKDFGIKSLDARGAVLHGLEHEVEGTFSVNGQTLTLRKVYAEQWTKKRGSAEKTFTGNTAEYFIDGVPAKKNEFTARIAEIVDEGAFKLLTSPTYFNEQLHWQDRRKILLEVCGDISDAEVVASDKALARLPGILGNRKLEDHRKVIVARRSEINRELERIPVRIDEAERGLPDATGIDPAQVQAEIAKARAEQNELRQELARVENGGEIAEQRRRLAEIETELIRTTNQYRAGVADKVQAKQAESGKINHEIAMLDAETASVKHSLRIIASDKETNESAIKLKREAWGVLNAQQFSFEQSETCPTCGQYLPREQLEEAREKALAEFNQSKAEELARISAEGKQLKSTLERLNAEECGATSRLDGIGRKIADLAAQRDKLQSEITDLTAKSQTYASDPAYIAKTQEKAAIEGAIAKLQTGSQGRAKEIADMIARKDNVASFGELTLLKIKTRKDGEARISELKAQEKALAAEYERLENELYLSEQFIRTKVKLLEDKINARFSLARFKMFEEQINGGLAETCQTTLNGVPYSDLNHGAKLNVGLDIIGALIDHYGLSAPVFVDNAEAVTRLLEIPAQTIKLVVSEPDKVLRVEHEQANQNLFEEAM
jgi:DNA repair exonuclease SbcCD ATPase subunit